MDAYESRRVRDDAKFYVNAQEWFDARGYRPETIERFRISVVPKAGGSFELRFPCAGGVKIKRVNPGEKRYGWVKGRPPRGAIYALKLVPEDATEVYLVEGEPDVWTMTQAGLYAISFVHGAPSVPEASELRPLLRTSIQRVNIIYDDDPSGRGGAVKAAARLRALGLAVRVLALPERV